jgi:hypothetical protein
VGRTNERVAELTREIERKRVIADEGVPLSDFPGVMLAMIENQLERLTWIIGGLDFGDELDVDGRKGA